VHKANLSGKSCLSLNAVIPTTHTAALVNSAVSWDVNPVVLQIVCPGEDLMFELQPVPPKANKMYWRVGLLTPFM
jgi:hypothetical protein